MDDTLDILLSNDDGVFAPGIAALAEHLADLATLHVVAPDRDRSGASNSLTLVEPLRTHTLDNGFVSVFNGTPTDCVHLAITGLLDASLDMVVSGVNSGANLGDDVLYSGTVAAAIEGRYLGFPAMAVSLVSGERPLHFDTGARVAKQLVEQLISHPLDSGVILNVNVPDVPFDALNGFEVTRLGNRHKAEPVVSDTDPRGRKIYWIGQAGPEQDAGPGTDFYAVNQNCVSITPLQIDMTDHRAMGGIQDWVKQLAS